MMTCDTTFRKLRRRIFEGTKPYEDRSKTLSRLLRDIGVASVSCGDGFGEVLQTMAKQMFGTIGTDEAIRRLLPPARNDSVPLYIRVAAYARCAALAFRNPTQSQSLEVGYRREAVRLSKEGGLVFDSFVLLTNWLFAATYAGDLKQASMLIEEIDALPSLPTPRTTNEKADMLEWKARLKTHRAKYSLLKARSETGETRRRLLKDADALYQAAIDDEPHQEHRRVNKYIEWASRLIAAASHGMTDDFKQIEGLLETAHRSLDTHVCDSCRAYYFQTIAELTKLKGDLIFNADRRAALQEWSEAEGYFEQSLQLYTTMKHHFLGEVKKEMDTLRGQIANESKPEMIFLSHKGVDKAMVRRFYVVLEELGFKPWLDEKQLTAGSRIHRDIQRGFKQSCACVFFVTEAFKDEKYLEAEIDFANTEFIERGEENFRIITILFGGATVPEPLKRWVYKNCQFELEALLEILRALPITVGSVHSRKTRVEA